ncbi:MAG: hypothetical protein AYL32_000080 [Candidatus Bathyarchaeota archaeon B26-2]|nr:MAG: hypothetical protein AYL32_000080 [Candidatus Bathyarchaeota archaeon B26-2]
MRLAEEKFPVSEILKVIQGITIYKTEKWWLAVLLLEAFGRRQIATYLWNNKNGVWKRRQKFVISNKTLWQQISEAIEKLLPELK